MNLQVIFTSRFKKEYKKAGKRGCDMKLMDHLIRLLAQGEALPQRYRDHELSGNWSGYRECHVAPDWLLIYKIERDILVLTLVRTGSHADLFE